MLNVKKSIGRSKKGNIFLESITLILVLISMIVISFYSYKVYQDIMPDINSSVSTSPEAVQVLDTVNTKYPSLLDSAIAFAFIGLWIAALIAAFLIDSHPVFFILTMILTIFTCIVAITISNAYEVIFPDPEFNAQFPMSNFFMSNILIITIAIGVSIGLALFGKIILDIKSSRK